MAETWDANKALMTTHIWRLLNDKESLWVRWVHSYKLQGRNFWDVPKRACISWGWRKLLNLRDEIRPFFWSTIGDGKSTSVWYDKWDGPCPLIAHISPRHIYSAGFSLQSKVADLIHEGVWKWPVAWYDLFPVLINCKVPNVSANQHDRLSWSVDGVKLDDYSSNQVWESIRQRGAEVEWVNLVWFSKCIPRHSFLLWLVLKGKLKTHDRLKPWDVGGAINLNLVCCSLCKTGPDSHKHLFFECGYSSQVWTLIRNMADMDNVPCVWDDIVAVLVHRSNSNSIKSISGRLLLAAAVYYIWQERNARMFTNKTRPPLQLKNNIVENVRLRLASIRFKENTTAQSLLARWNLPILDRMGVHQQVA